MKVPNGLAEIEETFGQPENHAGQLDLHWQASNIVAVATPFPLRVAWDPDVSVNRIRCHRLVATDLIDRLVQILAHAGWRSSTGMGSGDVARGIPSSRSSGCKISDWTCMGDVSSFVRNAAVRIHRSIPGASPSTGIRPRTRWEPWAICPSGSSRYGRLPSPRLGCRGPGAKSFRDLIRCIFKCAPATDLDWRWTCGTMGW